MTISGAPLLLRLRSLSGSGFGAVFYTPLAHFRGLPCIPRAQCLRETSTCARMPICCLEHQRTSQRYEGLRPWSQPGAVLPGLAQGGSHRCPSPDASGLPPDRGAACV